VGAQLTYGTAGATGGGWSAQPGSLQTSYEERNAEPRWSWQRRGLKTRKDLNQFVSLWSFGCRVGGGDLEGCCVTGRGLNNADLWEPYSCDGDGTQSMNFLRGTCKDLLGVPVANAIVQAFVTATAAYQGEVQAKDDGTYTLGVQQSKATPHYLVAYKTGSPAVAGTTVNTLLPTNVDGT